MFTEAITDALTVLPYLTGPKSFCIFGGPLSSRNLLLAINQKRWQQHSPLYPEGTHVCRIVTSPTIFLPILS